MSGLTAEQRQKLLESIRQWGDSQDRIQSEQDHQAALAETLKDECQISEKHFKRVAKAHWAETLKDECQISEKHFKRVAKAHWAETLKDECQISEKHFKRVAKAHWADTVKKDREDTEAQLDLFEIERGLASVSAITEQAI